MKLRYRGDRTAAFNPDSFIGCDGRFFRPVSSEFDGEFTTVDYERVPLDQMGAQFPHHLDAARDRHERTAPLAQLFGARS